MEEFIPKYKKISDDIQNLAKVLSGQGKPLPSERKLSETFEVSRTTIKRALESLERQGIVTYIEGKGYIIPNRDVKIVSSMHISGFYEDIVSQRVNARMANYSEIEYLNISNPAVVMVVNNMAYWDGKPIELSYVYTDVFSTNLEYRFSK